MLSSLYHNNPFQMIYNADGVLFTPIVVHSGNMSGFCQVNYCDTMAFIESTDGNVDRDVVWEVYRTVRRYL